MRKMIFTLVGILGLSACAGTSIDRCIYRYNAAASQIQLGDAKATVLAALEPTQQGLGGSERKPSDSYLDAGATVEIVYYRSGRQPDGLTTDDEFTPYVFRNGRLVAIGWAALGGPKTHGQTPQTNITVY
jgi:hypothetical protein